MSYESRLEKVQKLVDVDPNIERWESVILDGRNGKYYTNELSSNRRQLSDTELAELRQPGIGLIVLRLVDAPIPEENKKESDND